MKNVKVSIALSLGLLMLAPASINADIVKLQSGKLINDIKVADDVVIQDGREVAIIEDLEDKYEIFVDEEIYIIPKENLIITKVESYDEDNTLLSKQNLDNNGYLLENIVLNIRGDKQRVLKGENVLIKDYEYGKYKVLYGNLFFNIPKDYITFNKEDVLPEEIEEEVDENKKDIKNLPKVTKTEEQKEVIKEKIKKPGLSFDNNEDIVGLRFIQDKLIENSTKRLGTPYLWGGSSDVYGFDCSGFVKKLYEEVGIELPRHSGDQAKVGTRVEEGEQMKIGDLLFFGRNKINHVGMYIGGDKFIHASSSNKGVVTSSIYSNYVKKDLSHVMRILD